MKHLKNIELLITGILLGLIWTVQLVHYPSFRYIDNNIFVEFHKHHTFFIGIIVAPLMITELLITIYLMLQERKYMFVFIIVIAIWFSTFFIQVPLHESLKDGMDSISIVKLINTNWIRTILWSIKTVILFYWFHNR